MTALLREVYADRARGPIPDADSILAVAVDRGHRLIRVRRSRRAAGAGALLVVVLTALMVVTPQTVHRPGHESQPAADTQLVPIDPAPPSAPLSLGLVPAGWQYLGSDQFSATYGDADGLSAGDPSFYIGKLSAIVEEVSQDGVTYPLTIAGHPAYIRHDPDDPEQPEINGGAIIHILMTPEGVTPAISVGVEDFGNAGLTDDQLIAVANTLDVRDLSHPLH